MFFFNSIRLDIVWLYSAIGGISPFHRLAVFGCGCLFLLLIFNLLVVRVLYSCVRLSLFIGNYTNLFN